MTNEHYLIVSYFVAVGAGLAAAAGTAAILSGPLRQALAGAFAPLGRMFRRLLPPWLILAVLLGFASVTYFDCTHGSYEEIVADRAHLAAKTRQHASTMATCLAVGLMTYSLALGCCLFARARTGRDGCDALLAEEDMPAPKKAILEEGRADLAE